MGTVMLWGYSKTSLVATFSNKNLKAHVWPTDEVLLYQVFLKPVPPVFIRETMVNFGCLHKREIINQFMGYGSHFNSILIPTQLWILGWDILCPVIGTWQYED